jgi:hypothetical protein
MMTDQGDKFAHLPKYFASCKTVNHSIEWVSGEGVTTSLGKAHNGILKATGRKLNVFKGNVPKAELDERWQELAWRVNFGFHKDSAITGEMLIAFFFFKASETPAWRQQEITANCRLPVVPLNCLR